MKSENAEASYSNIRKSAEREEKAGLEQKLVSTEALSAVEVNKTLCTDMNLLITSHYYCYI